MRRADTHACRATGRQLVLSVAALVAETFLCSGAVFFCFTFAGLVVSVLWIIIIANELGATLRFQLFFAHILWRAIAQLAFPKRSE